jgi:hypothetical protein
VATRSVPPLPCDADQQHVGLLGTQPRLDHHQGTGRHIVVAVDEPDIFAARRVQAGVAGRAGSAPLAQAENGQPRLSAGPFVEHLGAVIGGRVIDRDHLDVTGLPAEHRVQALRDIALNIADGHDDADEL